MPSRNLTDLDYRLQRAYTLAAHDYRVKYPEDPQPIFNVHLSK